jgi:hypothetical protein
MQHGDMRRVCFAIRGLVVCYASGYKWRAENSAIPQEDDRFVRCISSAYAATLLAFHEEASRDMTHYHALDKIDPQPRRYHRARFSRIGPRHFENRRDVLAQGLSDGIDYFEGARAAVREIDYRWVSVTNQRRHDRVGFCR